MRAKAAAGSRAALIRTDTFLGQRSTPPRRVSTHSRSPRPAPTGKRARPRAPTRCLQHPRLRLRHLRRWRLRCSATSRPRTRVGVTATPWRRSPHAKKRPRPPVGTTFTFTLNVAATVKLVFTTTSPGRLAKSKRACVAPTKHNTKLRKCTRTLPVGTVSLNAHSGTDRIPFQGRISPTKTQTRHLHRHLHGHQRDRELPAEIAEVHDRQMRSTLDEE